MSQSHTRHFFGCTKPWPQVQRPRKREKNKTEKEEKEEKDKKETAQEAKKEAIS